MYSGKYQRPKFGGVKQITFADYDNLKIESFIEAFEDFMNNSFMAQQDAELNNIKDGIVADIQKRINPGIARPESVRRSDNFSSQGRASR